MVVTEGGREAVYCWLECGGEVWCGGSRFISGKTFVVWFEVCTSGGCEVVVICGGVRSTIKVKGM